MKELNPLTQPRTYFRFRGIAHALEKAQHRYPPPDDKPQDSYIRNHMHMGRDVARRIEDAAEAGQGSRYERATLVRSIASAALTLSSLAYFADVRKMRMCLWAPGEVPNEVPAWRPEDYPFIDLLPYTLGLPPETWSLAKVMEVENGVLPDTLLRHGLDTLGKMRDNPNLRLAFMDHARTVVMPVADYHLTLG